MSAVMVATFFNLLFLMLMLRVVCTRLRWRGDLEEAGAAQGPADAERPSLQRVTPTVVLQPGNEVNLPPKRPHKITLQQRACPMLLYSQVRCPLFGHYCHHQNVVHRCCC
jgi:hypothetical protein